MVSWFELNSEDIKKFGDFTRPETQAVVIHAKLDDTSTLNIKSETDWPIALIGIGSILASLVTIFFTYRAQKQQTLANAAGLKNQVRANAANLRDSWMEQLRLVSSEFLQSAVLIVEYKTSESEAVDAELLRVERRRALLLQIRIGLYVGATSELAKKIVKASEKILSLIFEETVDAVKVSVELCNLEKLIVEQLEQAWEQAKSDLGLSSPSKQL